MVTCLCQAPASLGMVLECSPAQPSLGAGTHWASRPRLGDSLHCSPSSPNRCLARSLLSFPPFSSVSTTLPCGYCPAVRLSFQTKWRSSWDLFCSLQQKLGKCRARWALSQLQLPTPAPTPTPAPASSSQPHLLLPSSHSQLQFPTPAPAPNSSSQLQLPAPAPSGFL